MAFIEASLEELPVSANLGQSCLATKISAPGPSSFGWFRHNPERLANPVLVQKKNNNEWRMSVDYTDLNKHCPKILSDYHVLIK